MTQTRRISRLPGLFEVGVVLGRFRAATQGDLSALVPPCLPPLLLGRPRRPLQLRGSARGPVRQLARRGWAASAVGRTTGRSAGRCDERMLFEGSAGMAYVQCWIWGALCPSVYEQCYMVYGE